MNAVQQVLQAARTLVEAFAANDSEAYFAAFSEDATFVFYGHEQVLPSRAAYRELWDQWQRDGFRVLACESSNPMVSLHDGLAIFIHDVATRLQVDGRVVDSQERETIVFQQQEQGHWLACHEHLSAMPEQLPPT